MTDKPIAFTADGRPVFDNAPTVVILAVRRSGSLLAIRRGIEPGYGKIALPGGYHMKGETWRQAGARELSEETGFVVDPQTIRQLGETVTDHSGNNLLFAASDGPCNYDETAIKDGEALETIWLETAGEAEEWAFPLHYYTARSIFAALPGSHP